MSLDLTGFTNLVTVNCSSAGIVNTLDVTGLASLTTLDCNTNGGLTALTLTGCSALTTLDCNSCDVKPTLDVSPASGALATINCFGNASLVTLIVTGCSVLTGIACHDCAITSITDLDDCVSLQTLDCSFNGLSSLDIGTMPSMSNLICSANVLTNSNPTYIINNLLVDLVATTIQGGNVQCDGQTPAAPPSVGPPDGVAAVATLLGYAIPWTVTTD